MKIYQVNVEEVYIQPTLVLAKNRKEAIEKVAEGEGVQIKDWLEYSYTLDNTEDWTTYDEDSDPSIKEYGKRLIKKGEL